MRKSLAVLAVTAGLGVALATPALADTACEAGDDTLALVCLGDVTVHDLVDLDSALDLDER